MAAPEPTLAQLKAACKKGTPIPEAAAYAGPVHPDVEGDSGFDAAGVWSFSVDLGSQGSEPYSSGVLPNDDQLGPIQLVVCQYENAPIDTSHGGNYCWYSDNAGHQLRVTLLLQSITVRVLVARTGKVLGDKTFRGNDICSSVEAPPANGASTMTETSGADGYPDWIAKFTKLP